MREPERASRRALCSTISCSNKTEVKTSAFRNSWDLTVSQMSLEGKQRCVIRRCLFAKAPAPPLLLSHTLSAACIRPVHCPQALSASQSLRLRATQAAPEARSVVDVAGGGLGRMSGHWDSLLFTRAEKSLQWGQGRRRMGERSRSWTSQGQVGRTHHAPMALGDM